MAPSLANAEFTPSRLRLDEMHSALAHCFALSPRKPRIETDGDRVYLRGHVNSYYQKQLAQETVRPWLNQCPLVNELEVRD